MGPAEATYCMQEVHERICGDHMSTKAMAYKIIRKDITGQQSTMMLWNL